MRRETFPLPLLVILAFVLAGAAFNRLGCGACAPAEAQNYYPPTKGGICDGGNCLSGCFTWTNGDSCCYATDGGQNWVDCTSTGPGFQFIGGFSVCSSATDCSSATTEPGQATCTYYDSFPTSNGSIGFNGTGVYVGELSVFNHGINGNSNTHPLLLPLGVEFGNGSLCQPDGTNAASTDCEAFDGGVWNFTPISSPQWEATGTYQTPIGSDTNYGTNGLKCGSAAAYTIAGCNNLAAPYFTASAVMSGPSAGTTNYAENGIDSAASSFALVDANDQISVGLPGNRGCMVLDAGSVCGPAATPTITKTLLTKDCASNNPLPSSNACNIYTADQVWAASGFPSSSISVSGIGGELEGQTGSGFFVWEVTDGTKTCSTAPINCADAGTPGQAQGPFYFPLNQGTCSGMGPNLWLYVDAGGGNLCGGTTKLLTDYMQVFGSF